MEFKEGKCPKCQGVLQIPVDRDKIICMYCGEALRVADAIQNIEVQATAPKVKPLDYDHYICIAMTQLPDVLFSIEKPLENFKRDKYPEIFQNFYQKNEEVFRAIESAYIFADDGEKVLQNIAVSYVNTVEENMNSLTKKRAKEQKLMDFNLSMAVYVIPAILEYRGESSDLFVDQLLSEWKKHYPKTNLRKCSYEKINSGFRKKLCYITTAVCETLGKGDDCYELNLLRNYRDEFLVQQQDGQDIVNEYYDIAPTIVKRINKMPNHKEIYENVWKSYLSNCISLIEKNNNIACKEVYCNMVRDLQQKFSS